MSRIEHGGEILESSSSSASPRTVFPPKDSLSTVSSWTRIAKWFGALIAAIFRGLWLINPIRLWLVLRERFTVASVTLLLGGIISLNIIWGYPWTSMFAFSVSAFLIGLFVNGMMRPRLTLNINAPRAVPCGEPARVDAQVFNRGRFAALDFCIRWKLDSKGPHLSWGDSARSKLQPIHIEYLSPKQTASLSERFVWERRGIVPIPNLQVESMFPFHLFRSLEEISHGTTIAVTPRAILRDTDEIGRVLHQTLIGIITRIMHGDSMQYVGSREYQVGMPVIRWDFASWARVGRPIVREFSSPTMRQATLIVDLGTESGLKKSFNQKDVENSEIETLLSYAAYAIKTLLHSGVTLTLWTTDSILQDVSGSSMPIRCTGGGDATDMMVHLATVSSVDASASETGLKQILQRPSRDQIIVFSSRTSSEVVKQSAGAITWFSTSAGASVV